MGDGATVLLSLGALAGAAYVLLRSKSAAGLDSRSPREQSWPEAPSPHDDASSPRVLHFPPLVERWRGEVAKRAGDLPVDAILEWILIESGGDMSSKGIPGREAGIFQLDFPADTKYGATYAGLMAIAQRSQGRANPNDISWLSSADLDMEVGAGIRKIMAARDEVRQVLGQSGVTWPETSFDFGSAVKQIHAAPAVISELVPKIAQRDGPPSSWAALRHSVLAFPTAQMGQGLRSLANAPSKHTPPLQNRLEDTLANAEIVGHAWASSARSAAVAGWGSYT